jgi:hypothetical protein
MIHQNYGEVLISQTKQFGPKKPKSQAQNLSKQPTYDFIAYSPICNSSLTDIYDRLSQQNNL